MIYWQYNSDDKHKLPKASHTIFTHQISPVYT